MQLAHFVSASVDQKDDLVDYLLGVLANVGKDSEDVGVEPYNIPRNIMDPKYAFNFGFCDVC